MLTGRCSLTCSFTHLVERRDELPQLPSGVGGLIRSLRVNRSAKRQDLASNITPTICLSGLVRSFGLSAYRSLVRGAHLGRFAEPGGS
jgi:hypothetical protein